MTDAEFLADVTQQSTYNLTREEFERLVGLARIGAAVNASKEGQSTPEILAWAENSINEHLADEILILRQALRDGRSLTLKERLLIGKIIDDSALPQPEPIP